MNEMPNGQANILVVDDEEMIRRSLRRKLTKEGYQCQEAANAEEVLEQLKVGPAELVILDVMMPGRSGMQILPEIRENHPDTAVIMATAVTDANVIIECMKNGAQDYLAKPFNLDDVILSVERVLRKRMLEVQLDEYKRQLEEKVEEQTGEIRGLFLAAIESLVSALEAKDRYTAGHSRRVADIAVAIGQELGLMSHEMDDLHWGALLHDVGKIAVDPAIQNKPGKLTPEQYQHIMIHAHVGPGIVKPVANDAVADIIRYHHHHYDGSSPDQERRGDKIPLGARIVAVADALDAMTSDRPYRSAMPLKEALDEIKRCAGTQLDPKVVAAFLKIPVAEIMLAQA